MNMRIRVDDIDTKAVLEYFENGELLISYIGPQLQREQVYDLRLDFSPHSCADLRIKVITTYMWDDTTFLAAEVL